jgi:glycine/serine hydroxymethyltransferase
VSTKQRAVSVTGHEFVAVHVKTALLPSQLVHVQPLPATVAAMQLTFAMLEPHLTVYACPTSTGDGASIELM